MLQKDSGLPQLADRLAGNALCSLLLVNLNLCVTAMDESVSGNDSRKVAVPEEYHRVLLQQLGVEWLASSVLAQEVCWERASKAEEHIAAAAAAAKHQMNLTAASSSSSSAVAAAAMLTLLQAALLPPPGNEVRRFSDRSSVLADFVTQLSESAREAAAAVMLQPILTQLLPAGLMVLKAAKASDSSSNTAAAPASMAAEERHCDNAAAAATAGKPPLLASCATLLHALLSTGGLNRLVHLHPMVDSLDQCACLVMVAPTRTTHIQQQHCLCKQCPRWQWVPQQHCDAIYSAAQLSCIHPYMPAVPQTTQHRGFFAEVGCGS
jgi:hypothetical protein